VVNQPIGIQKSEIRLVCYYLSRLSDPKITRRKSYENSVAKNAV
jgi:hypothetical protein